MKKKITKFDKDQCKIYYKNANSNSRIFSNSTQVDIYPLENQKIDNNFLNLVNSVVNKFSKDIFFNLNATTVKKSFGHVKNKIVCLKQEIKILEKSIIGSSERANELLQKNKYLLNTENIRKVYYNAIEKRKSKILGLKREESNLLELKKVAESSVKIMSGKKKIVLPKKIYEIKTMTKYCDDKVVRDVHCSTFNDTCIVNNTKIIFNFGTCYPLKKPPKIIEIDKSKTVEQNIKNSDYKEGDNVRVSLDIQKSETLTDEKNHGVININSMVSNTNISINLPCNKDEIIKILGDDMMGDDSVI